VGAGREGVGLRRRRVLLTWWVSRRRPSWAAAVSPPPPSPPPPHPPPPPPRFPLPPAATAATLFVAFALLPIASEGHPCVPLCRVTFGLRAQPNLPGGRPGPPFSTNPGNELRGSRGLLVAMATEPSPNPLDRTPIPYPSALRSTLFRRPFLASCASFALPSPKRESFDILVRLSLTDRRSLPLSTLLVLPLSPFFAPPPPSLRLLPSNSQMPIFSFFGIYVASFVLFCHSSLLHFYSSSYSSIFEFFRLTCSNQIVYISIRINSFLRSFFY